MLQDLKWPGSGMLEFLGMGASELRLLARRDRQQGNSDNNQCSDVEGVYLSPIVVLRGRDSDVE